MNYQIDQALTELWDKYLRYTSMNADHLAIARLGESVNLLQNNKLPLLLDQKWRPKIVNEVIPEMRLRNAMTELGKDVVRLRHIMGSGTEFIFEETMLLITLRVDIQLALEFFESRNVDVECDLQDVDAELRKIARSGKNFSAYESARRMARKNWGLPITSKWLDS